MAAFVADQFFNFVRKINSVKMACQKMPVIGGISLYFFVIRCISATYGVYEFRWTTIFNLFKGQIHRLSGA